MKKLLLLTTVLCATLMLHAQTSNFIIFSENGERFQLILNGVLQNAKTETNVKVTGLNAPTYKCRAMFEDTKLGFTDFNIYFTEPGFEVTYNLKQNKKGEYVTRGVSAVPLAQAAPASPTQTVVVYSTTPPPLIQVAVIGGGTTTTTTQTTTTDGTNDNVNFNMGMNVDGMGGGININMSGMDGMNGTNTTTTTTSSTTVTHTGNQAVVIADPPPVATHVVYVQGYNGPTGCPFPMNTEDFDAAKRSISSKDFEDSKLTIAKQILGSNCMTCSQVRDIMTAFSFEATKLDFAKFAYGRTYDYNNYYKLNDAFDFESNISDLNAYINGYHR